MTVSVGLSIEYVSGWTGQLGRVWTAACESATDVSSMASVHAGIAFARNTTSLHLTEVSEVGNGIVVLTYTPGP